MTLISRLTWAAAFLAGLICLAVSIPQGRTPTTELLFGVAFLAGVLGMLADRARRA